MYDVNNNCLLYNIFYVPDSDRMKNYFKNFSFIPFINYNKFKNGLF